MVDCASPHRRRPTWRIYSISTDVQDRPTEFLDLTSLTLDEFRLVIPPLVDPHATVVRFACNKNRDPGIRLRGTLPSKPGEENQHGSHDYPYSDTCRTYASNARIYGYVNRVFLSSLVKAIP